MIAAIDHALERMIGRTLPLLERIDDASALGGGRVAAQVKKAAKQKVGSGFFIDRRHDVVPGESI